MQLIVNVSYKVRHPSSFSPFMQRVVAEWSNPLDSSSGVSDQQSMGLSSGSNFIELLKQNKMVNKLLLYSRTPVTNSTCVMVIWLVTLFW